MVKFRLERIQEYAAPVEKIWDLLANTNRLNRRIGLPPVVSGPPSLRRDGLEQEVNLRLPLGLTIRWREHPFEWVRYQRYRLHREPRGKLVHSFSAGLEMTPTHYGTRLSAYIEITTRRWFLPIARWTLARLVRRILRFVAESLQRNTAELPLSVAPRAQTDPKLVDRLSHFRSLGDTSRKEVSYLRLHLLESDDTELRAMRPFALADRWGTDRDETLSLFLRATREGLLEMDWQVLCPNCRVPKAQYRSLRDLSPRIHCDLCQITFEAELDRYIELRFSVAQQVRQTSDGQYCIGSPSGFPHILVQANLQPGESQTVSLTLPPEPLRCRTMKSNLAIELAPAEKASDEILFECGTKGWESTARKFKPGPAQIVITNRTDAPLTVDLECLTWQAQAVTAAYVTCLQEFRSLFALEVLPPDKQVGIRNITVLFSDLKSSTSLYENMGDAPAFSRVHRHFDFLGGIIEQHHGAIVKTMGDAVMAVFSDPGHGIAAALTIQKGIEEFCRKAGIDPTLVLKIGLHCGPAISLNSDGRLDYFGRTINIAARLQAKSEGSDIVVSAEFLEDPQVRAVLSELPTPLRPFRTRLKGIEGDQLLYRMRLERRRVPRRAAEAA